MMAWNSDREENVEMGGEPRKNAPDFPQPFVEDSVGEVDIREYLNLIWVRKWWVLGCAVSVFILLSAWSLTRPKMYTATTKIIIEPKQAINNNQFDAFVNYWQLDRYITDQVQVLETDRLAQRVITRLGLASLPEFSGQHLGPEFLLGRLKVEPVEGSNVVKLSLTAGDPHQAAEWLNAYVEEYISANIADGIEKTRKIYKVIQSRLDPLRKQVQTSEQDLMKFRENEGAVLLADEQKNVITEQVDTLTSEYAKAKAERIQLETEMQALGRLKKEHLSAVSFPDIMDDTAIASLLQKRGEAELELKNKLETYKEGHPVIKELRSRLEGIDQAIDARVKTLSSNLKTRFEIVRDREQSLYRNLESLRQEIIDLSKKSMEQDRLQEIYKQNKHFLEEMLARSNEADLSATSWMNNIRVIEPAVAPGGPSSPNIPRTMALGLVLGLFLGIGIVLALDFLDNSLRTPEQVERYLGLDTLTAVPKLTEENRRTLWESFQTLRTALLLAARGKGCQAVLVTSSIPSEGKTTISFNLAKTLAAAGDRVLLLDCDLRKPRLHRLMNVKNTHGLTTLVLGEGKFEDVVSRREDIPNVDLVSSGALPSNPPELFGKESFHTFLREARTRYDWIIIDTPPLATVTDPVITVQFVDMVLLVTEYGGVRRQITAEALKSLYRADARVVGVVLNKVDVQRDYYYSNYYYSYSHYGKVAEKGSTV